LPESVSERLALVYRTAELCTMLGVSHMWLVRETDAGNFPKPIRLSRRAIGYLASDVDDWLAAKAAERDAAA
jgi:prophage regulatory protein